MKNKLIDPATFTEPMAVFLVAGDIVFALPLKNHTIKDICDTKEIVATENSVSSELVVLDFMGEEKLDLSDCIVKENGKIEFTTIFGTVREANGIKPAFELNNETGMDLYLEFISKKDYCAAFDFA